MAESRLCPICQSPIPADAPGGQCPKCLLQAGFQSTPPSDCPLPATAASPSPGSFQPPSVEQLAQRFPQLEILELLGQGGMGAVYKARQPGLDRLVAVKILPPEVSRAPAFAERFTREARALARLNHPQIVSVYDFGQANGLYYFVMEYVDGANLRQLLRDGHLSPEQALAIVPQICEALQFAHDEGVVHRDIKPENILLDKRGRVKIADFGLSKLLHDQQPDVSLTGTHQVMGTLRYMAPEQMLGTKSVDHRADIYSLGVVFYELLTGEVPLGRFAPPSHKVQIDVRLDEVVLRALEQEPDKRYQRASQVKTEIESLCRGQLAIPPSHFQRPAEHPLAAGLRFWVTPQGPEYVKRVAVPLLILTVLTLVTVTGVALGVPAERETVQLVTLALGMGLLVLTALALHLWWAVRGRHDASIAAPAPLAAQQNSASAGSAALSAGGQSLATPGVPAANPRMYLVIGSLLLFSVLTVLAGGVLFGLAFVLAAPGSGAFWGWMGGAIGCLCGGLGSLAGCLNSYRQLTGGGDLLRAPQSTWFDYAMAALTGIGGLMLMVGILLAAIGGFTPTVQASLTIGGILLFQGGLFLAIRFGLREAESGTLVAQAPLQSIPGDQRNSARLSRLALCGALWTPGCFLLWAGGVLVAYLKVAQNEYVDPRQHTVLDVGTALSGLIVLAIAAFGTTFMGAVALRQISLAQGRLYGRRLAFADSMLYPLLGLGTIVFYFCNLIGFGILRSLQSPGAAEPTPTAAAFLLYGLVALVSCYFAGRAVWHRLVARSPVGPPSAGLVPNDGPPGRTQIQPPAAWELRWKALPTFVRLPVHVLLAMVYLFGLLLFFSFQASSSVTGSNATSAGPTARFTLGQPTPWLEAFNGPTSFSWSVHIFTWSVLAALVGTLALALSRRLEKAERGRAHSIWLHYGIWSVILVMYLSLGVLNQKLGSRPRGLPNSLGPNASSDQVSYWPGHAAGVRQVAVSTTGETIVSAGADGNVLARDLAGQEIGRLVSPLVAKEPDRAALFSVAISPQGDEMYAGGSTGVWRARLHNGQSPSMLAPTTGTVRFISPYDGGQKLAFIANGDTELVRFDLKSQQVISTLPIYPGKFFGHVRSACSSPGGKFLAATSCNMVPMQGGSWNSSEPCQLTVFDLSSGQESLTWTLPDYADFSFSCLVFLDDRTLAICLPSGQLRRWSVDEQSSWQAVEPGVRISPGRYTAACASRDGQLIYLAENRQVVALNANTGRGVAFVDLKVHDKLGNYSSFAIESLAATNDPNLVVAALWDGRVALAHLEPLADVKSTTETTSSQSTTPEAASPIAQQQAARAVAEQFLNACISKQFPAALSLLTDKFRPQLAQYNDHPSAADPVQNGLNRLLSGPPTAGIDFPIWSKAEISRQTNSANTVQLAGKFQGTQFHVTDNATRQVIRGFDLTLYLDPSTQRWQVDYFSLQKLETLKDQETDGVQPDKQSSAIGSGPTLPPQNSSSHRETPAPDSTTSSAVPAVSVPQRS